MEMFNQMRPLKEALGDQVMNCPLGFKADLAAVESLEVKEKTT